ncbi:MAG: zinc ribbon domain-containing protein [Coriobacteriales bacterium]|jgi:DNA-directed RNA polymerase subunit RPC12/RpoP|nr:zinc ribbon domain-containing protein [Coriobacteriales bacterium]
MDAERLRSMSGEELGSAIEDCGSHLAGLLTKLGDELYGETRDDARFLHGREDLYKAIGQGKAHMDELLAEQGRRQGAGSSSGACPCCGKPLEPGFGFCAWCGTQVQGPAGVSGNQASACPSCGARVLADDAFCMSCGTKLEMLPVSAAPRTAGEQVQDDSLKDDAEEPTAPLHVACPDCGFENLPTARFCHGCGRALR